MKQLALVGCAHIHTPGFVKRINDRDDIKVKCVWDHEHERAVKNAKELNTQVENNLEAVFADGEVDAVVICSETNRHRDLVLPAAAAGKHLFVEKPLGFATDDAFEMAAAIEKAGVLFQTGYFMRGDSKHQWLRHHVQKGSFGRISRIRHSNCHSGSIGRWFDTDWRWMADPSIAGCGAFGDLGTHSLDILMWVLGDVAKVTGDVNVILGNYDDCDESGEALLKFDNGALASLAGAWVDVANPVQWLISGAEGYAQCVGGKISAKGKAFDGEGKDLKEVTDLPEGWPHAFELFLDAVNGKQVELVTVREAANRSAVMDAIYQGAKSSTWVEPKRM